MKIGNCSMSTTKKQRDLQPLLIIPAPTEMVGKKTNKYYLQLKGRNGRGIWAARGVICTKNGEKHWTLVFKPIYFNWRHFLRQERKELIALPLSLLMIVATRRSGDCFVCSDSGRKAANGESKGKKKHFLPLNKFSWLLLSNEVDLLLS